MQLYRGARWALGHWMRFERWLLDWFRGREPKLRYTILPFILLSTLLYMRWPDTNYIFDEQEALLANPYVNGKQDLQFWDVIHRDFWGLPPNASIGSYRPIPNIIWRATWSISKHPFVHSLYNLLFHGLNGAMLASFAYAVSKRRLYGWLVGATFVTAGVLTEAVSGIVGIADVLGGIGAVTALLCLRLPATFMAPGVFLCVTFGLFCKESAIVCVPLLPVAAALTAPMLHPHKPSRFGRAILAFLAALSAMVLYVELRKHWFPSPLPSELNEPLPDDAGTLQFLFRDFLVWFHQAPLPTDPVINNPLANAPKADRYAGALRVYWRGLTQVFLPVNLSGDYSYNQEPVPDDVNGWETMAGGVMMLVPPVVGLLLWLRAMATEWRDARRAVPEGPATEAVDALYAERTWSPVGPMMTRLQRRAARWPILAAGIIFTLAGLYLFWRDGHRWWEAEVEWLEVAPRAVAVLCLGIGLTIDGRGSIKRPLTAAGVWPWRHIAPVMLAIGMVWMVVSYFPHSNIPKVLPTVRAERFWYFPVIGSSLAIAVALASVCEPLRGRRLWRWSLPALVCGLFLGTQAQLARRHAAHYTDDLIFWRATKDAVPNSAKAHLNYSVMVGARGDLETRLEESYRALAIAPGWSMANIYTGDTLCRMHRPHDAWPHYKHGFELAPNDRGLISLALQCMHDENILLDYERELRTLSGANTGSWLAYLVDDTLKNHDDHGGVSPDYRPRSYNQGAE